MPHKYYCQSHVSQISCQKRLTELLTIPLFTFLTKFQLDTIDISTLLALQVEQVLFWGLNVLLQALLLRLNWLLSVNRALSAPHKDHRMGITRLKCVI